jgi:hypothetical protein
MLKSILTTAIDDVFLEKSILAKENHKITGNQKNMEKPFPGRERRTECICSRGGEWLETHKGWSTGWLKT